MQDRVVLVTGGSRGIGRAVALRFAERGSKLLINFFQDREAAEKTAREVTDKGANALSFQADVKDPEQIRGMFREIQARFGRLDVLVHNAASGVLRQTLELTAKHWDWVMATNARSLLLCAREAAAAMTNGGRIVSLSSLGSDRVIPQYAAIGVSKAALESLTRYLAAELAPRGITVNAVSAGAVPTEIWNLIPDGQMILEKIRERTPCARLLTPEDVAEIVYFLASPQARMIQGQVVVVDGGYSLVA